MHEFQPEICLIAEPKQKTEHLDLQLAKEAKAWFLCLRTKGCRSRWGTWTYKYVSVTDIFQTGT